GGASPSAPKPPDVGDTATPFPTRVLDRVSANAEGMAQFPGNALRDARSRYQARNPQGVADKAIAAAQSSIEAVGTPIAESAASLTPPGIAARAMRKEDPAALTGDALMMLTPGTEELGKATHATVDTTKAGSLYGAMTRAKNTMDHLDSVA